MKSRHILALGVALGFAQLALAAEPTAPNPQSLGMVEGILNKCAELDAPHAAEYRDQVKMVTQDASEKAVAEARSSDEYKKAYDAIMDSLAKVGARDAVKACMGSLAPSK